jgi:glucose/arabinose dehydrogenase
MNAKKILVAASVLITAFLLSGCQLMSLFHREVQEPPAPTAIPLPDASGKETAAPQEPGIEGIPPQEDINLPAGFGISVFIEGLKGPRMMAVGPDNHLYVAERTTGRILRLPDRDQNGVADGIEIAAEELLDPSSLAFYKDGSMYVGETTRVIRLLDPDGDGYFQEREVIVAGIPAGGHTTRTVIFSPDYSHLYVSIGSSCNVCEERDSRRASVMRYKPDGSDEYRYATGLRNAVGLAFHPGEDRLYASNNGRDWLGDDLPPETIYALYTELDAGWPSCHAARIIDPEFGNPDSCQNIAPPKAEIQAHTAPLGITFYTGDQFPEEYRNTLFVALHGSWNRSVPVGYSVVQIVPQPGDLWPVKEFAVGWLREDGSHWGRPVDLVNAPDGSLFLSEDGQGTIYRIYYDDQP